MKTVYTPLAMLAKLVSFDTTSSASNLGLIEFVEDYLDQWQIEHFRVDYEVGKKTNLFATIGPKRQGGIVLSGHTDVVPVTGQKWHSDPFVVTERGDRVYGRGTCDMKGFLAVALAMVPEFVAAGLKTPIHLALSCDEEVGCKGVRPLLAALPERNIRPALAIIGEPTLMQVVNAHKSAVTFSTEVTGFEAHSSLTDQGVNAIMVAGELLGELNRLKQQLIRDGDPSGRFQPPYSTLHVGLIQGGTAKNIIPRRCHFQWEARLLPRVETRVFADQFAAYAKALEPEMLAIAADTGIVTTQINAVPGLAPQENSPAEALALHLVNDNHTSAVSYCTEAGLFQQAGLPAIICGPGSIEQAHKPDEFIARSELDKCQTFMRKLAAHCLRPML